jgi:uncharacterized damage-inducible protein DinB
MSERLAQIIDLIERNFAGRAWHGSTLCGVLRRVTPEEALLRPGPGRKCIWEHILHAAYWKYVVRRRLAGGPRFPRSPANWPGPSGSDREALDADLAVLEGEHALLVAAVRDVRPASLDRPLGRGLPVTRAAVLVGVASHDAYHTGQIQLIRAIIREAGAVHPKRRPSRTTRRRSTRG